MSELQTTQRRAVRKPASRAASSPLPPLLPPHALLADVSAPAQELRAAELRAAGFRVSIARTGFEAIVKASCHVPDLILIGSLGDMGAAETARLITTCPMTAHIPVLQMAPGRRVPQRKLSQLRRAAV